MSSCSGASSGCWRAAFTMNPTAPFFLGDAPARHPVRESICAIVRICWGRRLRRLAANVVVTAAPLLFGSIPTEILAHSAVVWIDRAHRSGRRCGWWQWTRWWRQRPRRRRRGGRRRRRRRERRGWDGRRGLWQSCGRAAPANGHAAVVFLRLGPGPLDHVAPHVTSEVAPRAHAGPAVVWQRGGRAGQEPEQKREKQQETQKTAACDDASEVSLGAPEISSVADILIRRFLCIATLASTHVGQRAIASAAAASDTTSSAVLPRSYTASSSAAIRATAMDTTAHSASTAEPASAAAAISSSSTHSTPGREIHGCLDRPSPQKTSIPK